MARHFTPTQRAALIERLARELLWRHTTWEHEPRRREATEIIDWLADEGRSATTLRRALDNIIELAAEKAG